MNLVIFVQHDSDLWNVPSWFAEKLRSDFAGVDVTQINEDQVGAHLADAEIMFTIALRADQIAKARKLRWIHAPTAAVNQLLIPELVNSDIVVTNSTEVHGTVVAEHVLALIFALA